MNRPVDRLRRILLMIPYIQQHPGISVEEVAAFTGCKPETIPGDLDAALLCGVPPYLPSDYISIVVEDGRIYVSFAEHFKRPVNLTFEEALSLNLALSQVPVGRKNAAAALELRRKILKVLPRNSRALWREARRQLQVGAGSRPLQERVALLEQAIEDKKEIHIEYYTASRDEMTERDVQPYGMIEHNGEWYFVGHCLLRDRELPFRVDRIRALKVLDKTFDPPKKFNIEKYRRPQMYFPTMRDMRVKLRVVPEYARWIHDELPEAKTRRLPDGGIIAHLSVHQPEWMVLWALSHAGKVEVLAPFALRKQIAQAAQKALQRYDEKNGRRT